MHKHKRLIDSYRFEGYEPSENLTGIFGDPKARIIHLRRHEKKQYVHCARLRQQAITTERHAVCATFLAEAHVSTSNWSYAAWSAGDARG
jgi:hypothetical protein